MECTANIKKLADVGSLNVDHVYGFLFLPSFSHCTYIVIANILIVSSVDTTSISRLAMINLSLIVSTILPRKPK